MSQDLETDLKQIVLSNASFGPQDIQIIRSSIVSDMTALSLLREAVGELESQEGLSPAASVRLGVCQFLLGRFKRSIEALREGDGGALAHFYLAKAQFALEDLPAALASYESAAKAGYDADSCALGRAEVLRNAKRPEESLASLDSLSGAVEQTAEYLYQRGATVAKLGGNREEVVALYARAVEADPDHPGALFGLALENDRCGNDGEALQLYERSTARIPAHVGSLLNLGLLYEDMGRYDNATRCYQRILEIHPSHPRARLFFKDADASRDMLYDEDAQRRHDRLAQLLNVSVADFELSVRSRNCLQKMGINTLGDLTRASEQELLNSKNFGETSLVEIREMLAAKGLSLGQFAHQRVEEAPSYDPESLSPDEKALLDRPISDLNLSVRARKCMVRLGLTTIGELVRRTGDDLLECKNFGVTSLNEVREKMTRMNLKLRGDSVWPSQTWRCAAA